MNWSIGLAALILSAGANLYAAGQGSNLMPDIERNPDGTPLLLKQYDAVTHCQKKYNDTPLGAHLPTARELAAFTEKFEGKKLLEVEYVNKELGGAPPVGYQLISSKGADDRLDSFYFSYTGYEPELGKVDLKGYWTSSITTDHFKQAYYLGYLGFIQPGPRHHYYLAVRCAFGR